MVSNCNIPTTWEKARTFLGEKSAKVCGNNTVVREILTISFTTGKPPETSYAIELHGHRVAILYPDGRVMISSCGFRTKTTKDRINRVLPQGHILFQNKNEWYVFRRGEKAAQLFQDGMIISPLGYYFQDTI